MIGNTGDLSQQRGEDIQHLVVADSVMVMNIPFVFGPVGFDSPRSYL